MLSCYTSLLEDGPIKAELRAEGPRAAAYLSFLVAGGFKEKIQRELAKARRLFLAATSACEQRSSEEHPTDDSKDRDKQSNDSWTDVASGAACAAASENASVGDPCADSSQKDATPGGSAAPAAEAPPAVVPEAAGRRVPLERLQRAAEAGRQARLKMDGRKHNVGETPALAMVNRFYVVLRGTSAETPPGLFSRWKDAKPLVEGDGARGFSDRAVFHGFPSLAEVESYCGGAGVPVPGRR